MCVFAIYILALLMCSTASLPLVPAPRALTVALTGSFALLLASLFSIWTLFSLKSPESHTQAVVDNRIGRLPSMYRLLSRQQFLLTIGPALGYNSEEKLIYNGVFATDPFHKLGMHTMSVAALVLLSHPVDSFPPSARSMKRLF